MSFVFLKLFDFFSKRKHLLFIVLFLLVALFTLLSFRLKFKEDITDFLPKTKNVENVNDVFRLIKSNDKLVVIISDDSSLPGSTERLITSADALAGDIRSGLMPYLVKDITYRISEDQMSETFDVLWNNLPFFLDDNDYRRIAELIDPLKIDSVLNGNYKILISPAGIFMSKYLIRDPLSLSRYALQKLSLSSIGNGYEINNGYIFSKDRKNLLLFLSTANQAGESYKNTELIDKLDDIISANEKRNDGKNIKIRYCGAVAATVCNARQMKTDFAVTMSVALAILLVFFGMFFKNKRTIFMLMLPVVFGGLFALGFIGLINPHISLIAIGAGSIILGIAINYSIHFYSHYRHEPSVKQVIKDLASPLTIGSTTTIGAFLGLMFVKSDVLKDFGLFSALCLVGSVLFTLIFLPFFIKNRRMEAHEAHKTNIIDKFSAYHFERNPYIIGGIIILTVFFYFMSRDIRFEDDLSKLGYMSTKLKDAEQTLNNISDSSLRQVFVVSKGKDLNEALRRNENLNIRINELRRQGIISQVSGVSPVLLSDSMQKIRIAAWESFWSHGRKENAKKWISQAAQKLSFRESSFSGFFSLLDRKFERMSGEDFEKMKERFSGQFVGQEEKNNFVLTLLKINPQNHDKVLAAIPEDEHTVVVETRSLLSHFIDIINRDFNTILLISSLLVFFFLLFSYGRIELALIAFIPMLISWIWILGIMSLLDIRFNIFSIIISAFIFGLGDDYSIFIMDGLMQEYKKGVRLLDSYKTAVFLSAFTTFVGVGVLIFARHPALRSIALLTIIGMLSVVFLSYTIAPALFKLLVYKKSGRRKFPVTLSGFLYALVCYSYFISGCIVSGLLRVTIINLLPVKRKKCRLIFQYLMMYVCRSTIYLMFMAKKRIINLKHDTFNKPSVIICNHQSMIDIPVLMMFNPKIIMLTNDSWYYSKFGGIFVRMLGYLAVSHGNDYVVDKCRDYVADGYSIMVFPEGSRSGDQQIHRFHKGAFYLAGQLNLDIVPLMIHGTGHYVSKGELMGKRSVITLKVLDRITLTNPEFGDNDTERAKKFTALYRKEFDSMLDDYRNTDFYSDLVVRNFIYKGPVTEWYTRIKLKLEKNYSIYNDLIPMKAKILDIGCGYGYMALLLGLVSKDREIKGVDYDEEKIDVATHCSSRPENVSFLPSNIMDYEMEREDVFILSDVLHYLEPENQSILIRRCIGHLNNDGKILIRDGNRELAKRHGITKLTEIFSTNFGFNKTKNKLHFISESMLRETAANNNMELRVIDNNKVTSNMLFVLSHKKQDG